MTTEDDRTTTEDNVLETPAQSRFWIKNSKGQPSATLTFATVSFAIVALSYVAGMFTSIGPIELRAVDPAAVAALLVPTLGAYLGRRYTDSLPGKN